MVGNIHSNRTGTVIYLKIMNGTPKKTTMRRITEMANIYNPNKNTDPCYHLKRKNII
jgi:hypothetical protein